MATLFDKLTKRPDVEHAAAFDTPGNFKLVLAKEAMAGVLDQLGVAEAVALVYVDIPGMQAGVPAACLPFVSGPCEGHAPSSRWQG